VGTKILKEIFKPQLKENMEDFVFQKDCAPPDWHCDVQRSLNERLPDGWIGCCTEDDLALLRRSPRSPDLTECHFILWGYKDTVIIPPLARTLPELRERIRDAVTTIIQYMFTKVWAT
jgi:hypothetical protein